MGAFHNVLPTVLGTLETFLRDRTPLGQTGMPDVERWDVEDSLDVLEHSLLHLRFLVSCILETAQ